MNILIFIRSTTFHNKSGGLETQNKTLAEGFAKLGNGVWIVSTSNSNIKEENVNGVNYIFTNSPSGRYTFSWWRESLKTYKELLKKFKIGLLISQSSAGETVFKYEKNIKKITICHGTSLGELKNRIKTLKTPRNFARFVLRDIPALTTGYFDDLTVFKNSNKIVCVSKILSGQVCKEYPMYKNKIEVVDNGVDLGKFRNQKSEIRNQKSLNLLYVGRIDKEKGIGVLISAFSGLLLKAYRLQLVIVGSGPHLEEFKKMTSDLGVDKKVEFVGEVNNEKVIEYYQQADIFVLPSLRQEGFPMVLAEAMACGLPIVASRVGGIPSSIKDSENGLLVTPGNKEELIDALDKLVKDLNLRSKLAKSGVDLANKRYSQGAMVENYLRINDKISL